MQHARLSPSGSEKWMNCPGSVKAEQDYVSTYGEKGSGVYAEEGTRAHSLGETTLIKRTDPSTYIGDMIDGHEITADMAVAVQYYVDYVRNIPGDLKVECRIDLTKYIPDSFGTCDAHVISDTTLHVIDYKHGMGVPVYAEKNSQLMLYALGILEEGIEEIHLHIVQPRIHNTSTWIISRKELLIFGEEVRIKAAKAMNPNSPRIASEKACKWCKAKATCPELNKLTTDLISMDFEDLNKIDLAYILENEPLILAHLAAVKEHSMNYPPKGWKLVEGISHRKWIDEKKVMELLGDEGWTKKPITPAQALKLKILPKGVEDLIYKPKGAPKLVPDSDKREAITAEWD